MTVTEKYTIDKAHECKSVFRTTDIDHPGVKMVMEQGEVNLAGPVKVLSEGEFPAKYGRALHDAGADARASSRRTAGRRSPHSRRAIRCTARTNIS